MYPKSMFSAKLRKMSKMFRNLPKSTDEMANSADQDLTAPPLDMVRSGSVFSLYIFVYVATKSFNYVLRNARKKKTKKSTFHELFVRVTKAAQGNKCLRAVIMTVA